MRLARACLSVIFCLAAWMLPGPRAAAPSGAGVPDYQPVAGWPKLEGSPTFGPVSAVGTDSRGNVYVLQRSEPPVLVFDADGRFLRSWGKGRFQNPHGLRVDPADHVWITDTSLHLVTKLDAFGTPLLTLGSSGRRGDGPDRFDRPTDVAVSAAGDIYVADGYGNSRVVKFSKEGKFLKKWGKKGAGPGEFNIPHAICLDRRGRVFVGDRENNRVQVFDGEGRFLAQWKESGAPYGLCVMNDRLLVADGRARWVLVLDMQGKVVERWGTGTDDLHAPTGLTWTGAVYLAFVGGRRAQKLIVR